MANTPNPSNPKRSAKAPIKASAKAPAKPVKASAKRQPQKSAVKPVKPVKPAAPQKSAKAPKPAKSAKAPQQAARQAKPAQAKAKQKAPQRPPQAAQRRPQSGANAVASQSVSTRNVGEDGALMREKRGTQWFKILLVLVLLPIGGAMVYLQFFGSEDQKLKDFSKENITSFKSNVQDLIVEKSKEVKQRVEDDVAPVVAEKSKMAWSALKIGWSQAVDIAEAQVDKWGQEKANLSKEIEGDDALKEKFQAFEEKGVDKLIEDITQTSMEEHKAKEEKKVRERRHVSYVSGPGWDEASSNIFYAQRLISKAGSMKKEEAKPVYGRAEDRLVKAKAYFERSIPRAKIEGEKERLEGFLRKVERIRGSYAAILHAPEPEPAKAQEVAANTPKTEPPKVDDAERQSAVKVMEEVAKDMKKVAEESAKVAKANVAKKEDKPKEVSIFEIPESAKKKAGIQGDKHYVSGEEKLAEGLSWYKKATPDLSNRKRTYYLKQALVRFDKSMQSFVRVSENKKYKGKKDRDIIDERLEKVMFLRYACMKSMTL